MPLTANEAITYGCGSLALWKTMIPRAKKPDFWLVQATKEGRVFADGDTVNIWLAWFVADNTSWT